ncbi:MAG TPA: hypothetical protein VFL62_24425 [Bradyrhizobium sp.]|nr:hypothetical protein [Bradyrhizobium sp.]HET7889388.1 hypothetical protein [Bradyrhizobium sp.]
MSEIEDFSSLVGHIYDASFDPLMWPDVLRRSCEYVVGISAALASHDVKEKTGQFFYSWNDDPEYTRLYLEKYSKFNPAIVPMMSSGVGEVVAISTVIPYQEYLASRLHTEWARPQAYVDSVHTIVEKTATSFATVSIARNEDQGVADEAAFERMRRLSPHFRPAVAVSKSVRQQKVEVATLADTLEGIEAALFVVDAAGRIVHMNAAAQDLADASAVVRGTPDKQFVAMDTNANALLRAAFASAEAGDASMGSDRSCNNGRWRRGPTVGGACSAADRGTPTARGRCVFRQRSDLRQTDCSRAVHAGRTRGKALQTHRDRAASPVRDRQRRRCRRGGRDIGRRSDHGANPLAEHFSQDGNQAAIQPREARRISRKPLLAIIVSSERFRNRPRQRVQ